MSCSFCPHILHQCLQLLNLISNFRIAHIIPPIVDYRSLQHHGRVDHPRQFRDHKTGKAT